ncbi:hypothetical protein SMKI_16G2980 [Saccharomyces mikatae IFO 1815]|uniref:YPR148C-like protein n=1 Tax=Saccharomyces mikatae IFO 1815 TaxID=226126 RepID=A0AA35IWF2_SACMI|nr:uncharacterized protein SMKI_16G2980 [Saccharomyces mikatae IFO 1815]CAI4037001.1 hypothetical protein SMKI_16G2980 [Saccharomyces mikatae IFO 1815]
MSGYFSSFSLNKITDSIATAAHKTHDTLNNALANANVNLNDPQTRLSIKSRTRFVQESLGTISDISKLPPQYQFLEKKSDSLEKVCKRILLVSKTFEVEGYDYPPNLTESISDWWSLNKDGWFGSKKSEITNKKKGSNHDDAFLPRSFAQAISKAAVDCEFEFQNLENDEKAELKKKRESTKNAQTTGAQDEENEEDEDEEEEEDEDLSNLIKVFDSWSTCYKNIDEGKTEMDSMMVKEFNKKLEKLINQDFKRVHELRKKVEISRLKFDTMRYEVKAKEAQLDAQKPGVTEEAHTKDVSANTATSLNEIPSTVDEKQKSNVNTEAESKKEANEQVADDAVVMKEDPKDDKKDDTPLEESEENKLLEKLEDEFVSNTTAAVETMEEIADSSEILGLIKLFQNFQLVYFRQCVQEVEANLKVLNGLEN